MSVVQSLNAEYLLHGGQPKSILYRFNLSSIKVFECLEKVFNRVVGFEGSARLPDPFYSLHDQNMSRKRHRMVTVFLSKLIELNTPARLHN
jgi:hypothetical protein